MSVVGIDTRGTFTDFILFDGKTIRTHKVLSTPEDPSRAVLQGLRELGGLDAEVIHGSTVATNAFLERKGAKLSLVTTRGFEDLLEIGRQARGSLYDLAWTRPEPLVPRSRRYGIRGRMDAGGRVITPLDRAALRRIRSDDGAGSGRLCSATLGHEREAGRISKGATLSSDVLPEYREYRRLSATVLSAYVAPVWIDTWRLRKALEIPPLASDGGSISADSARRRAAQTLLSVPQGDRGATLGSKVISFTWGTSTDVAHQWDGDGDEGG
jgi:N-methylhydantoinase A